MNMMGGYKVFRESIASQIAGNRENPARVMKFTDGKYGVIRIVLSVGDSDDFYAFREGDMIYVLAVNYRMGYLGLNAYDLTKGGAEAGDIFLQSTEQIEESIGKKWEDYVPMTLCKRLQEYLGE